MSSNKSGSIFTFLLVGAIGVGLAYGFLVPEPDSELDKNLDSDSLVGPATNEGPPPAKVNTQSFPLSQYDLQDRLQAPQLASNGAGKVWVAWESQTSDNERTIFLARSEDGGQTYSDAKAVRTSSIHQWDAMIRGRASKRSSRMWPHIDFADGKLILSWVESGKDDPSQQTLMFAESTDLGESFAEPSPLSSDSAVRPTFVGADADESGRVVATWLDHRHDVQQPFAANSDENGTDQLVYAGPDEQGICPCCDLDIKNASDGSTLIAFRNSIGGYRDMWICFRAKGESQFSPPQPVVEPRWEFNGCPHDGPSMAIIGNQVHIVWMDAHTGVQQVYYGKAKIGEWNFEVKPVSPSTSAQSHANLIAHDDRLWISWDESGTASTHHDHAHTESSGSNSLIMLASSVDGGNTFSPHGAISNDVEGLGSRPTLLQSAESLIVAWTALSENGKQIHLKAIPLGSETSSAIEVASHE